MARTVELTPAMERQVRFVEDTAPGEIVAATLASLGAGEAAGDLLAAAALAVSRSTELPPDHHGGPIHPVSGIHAVCQLASRLDGDRGFLPVVQSVALANKHIHAPDMGPAAMPALAPLAAGGLGKADLLAGFAAAMRDRQVVAAERHLLALLEIAGPGEIMEAMLEIALPRNALDDHYLLYCVYAFRALDDVGWDWAPVVLRPPVRYLARHPLLEAVGEFTAEVIAEGVALYRDFGRLEALLDEHGLSEDRVPLKTDESETAAICVLAERIGHVGAVREVTGLLARAMADGLSLEGAGEALSAGGGLLCLRSRSGNPFDVHIHTGVNARRYLIGLEGLGFRTKVLALLGWPLGLEVRHMDPTLAWAPGATPEALAALPERGRDDLLAAIAHSVLGQPPVDMEAITVTVDQLIAPEGVQDAAVLAQLYAGAGHEPGPFFALLADLVCRDDQSEMHAYKLQQAAFEEYHAVREPLRWVHMASAAKHAAVVANLRPQSVYPEAVSKLAG